MIKPLRDFVVCEEVKIELSSIIKLEGVDPDVENHQAKVLACGSEVKDVKVGDTVLIKKYGFDQVEYEKVNYLVGKEESIYAIV
jgi:co-chaperonin GroES (HSP10)